MLSQFLSKVQTGTKCATIHQNIEIQQFLICELLHLNVQIHLRHKNLKRYQLVLKSPAG